MVEAAQTPWWSVASAIGSALATIAVAVFAAVELWAMRQRRLERERTSGARIAAVAFLARRQLKSWLGYGAGSTDDFEGWIRDAENAKSLARHLDVAEARFIELLELASDAATELAVSVRAAAVHFFSSASRLNNYVSTARPDGIEVMDWVQLRNDAWADLRDCIRLLDDKVGASVLLQEARLLDAKRAAANPSMDTVLSKLADGLASLQAKVK